MVASHESLPGLNVGVEVRITNAKSVYYQQTGTIEEIGEIGGWYVRHPDGEVAYHPWGLERLRPLSYGPGPKV